jgi:hypothetical protein
VVNDGFSCDPPVIVEEFGAVDCLHGQVLRDCGNVSLAILRADAGQTIALKLKRHVLPTFLTRVRVVAG